MSEQAIKLVEECIAKKSDYLDLGRCGLRDKDFEKGSTLDFLLPQCAGHLRTLVLSNSWGEYGYNNRYIELKSNNKGENNLFTTHQPSLLQLNSLIALLIGGENGASWKISDMSFVVAFPKLQILYAAYNNISKIGGLDYLTNLRMLDISHNKISELNGHNNLNNLQFLGISGNQISEIKHLDNLKKLQLIDISANQISELKGLDKLSNLQVLDISYNQINYIDGLDALTQLRTLTIHSNGIVELTGLTNLNNLEVLDITHNQINELKGLETLTKLQQLYIYNNQINELKGLDKLTQLQQLHIAYNQINELKGLDKLTQLQQLHIANNQIKDLRHLLSLRPFIEDKLDFNFNGNPLKAPPPEIAHQGTDAIKAWFAANKVKLNEIKVLLIGDAKAGKTSLCNRLKDDTFNPEQEQTDGIFINQFQFNELHTFNQQAGLQDIKAYFWDFGGQEIMSATHQFFMTKRSVYVLLMEARKDANADQEVRRWMERIRAFGGDSPVIIVGNKIELHRSFGIDTPKLQQEYPQIKAFINVSCATGENMEQLKDLLAEWLPKGELFNTEIDERWLPLKNELQELTGKAKKLSHAEFTQLCIKHRIEDEAGMSQAIHFLNDLGIVLHFDEIQLAEYFVLDPLWVTAGVYRIITSETAASQKGKILVSELSDIVNKEAKEKARLKHVPEPEITYSPYECHFLAEIMAQFKLAYFTDNKQYLLIPDLLDKETPVAQTAPFEADKSAIRFVYDYKYLPTAILPRLMTTFKDEVAASWHTGFILRCDGNMKASALITTSNNRIQIIVTGEHKQKREFLSIIRFRVDEINSDYTLDIQYLIPLPGIEGKNAKYSHLLKLERRGEHVYEDLDTETEFEISVLLDGITRKEDLPQEIKNLVAQNHVPGINKKKIFLASSLELKDDREAFEIAIGRLNDRLIEEGSYVEVVKWEKSFLDAMDRERLQNTYNRAIKECDIFVMLYKTKVGMYTAEEFGVAFGHFTENSKPLIYTYFKNVPADLGKISREDFNSLHDFKDKLKALGHFETEYSTPDNLMVHFRDRLDGVLKRG